MIFSTSDKVKWKVPFQIHCVHIFSNSHCCFCLGMFNCCPGMYESDDSYYSDDDDDEDEVDDEILHSIARSFRRKYERKTTDKGTSE